MTSQPAKVALVTGSAKRIGAEIVRRLHNEGYNVILHYNGSRPLAEAIAEQLNTERDNSITLIQYNLLDFDNMAAFAEQILSI